MHSFTKTLYLFLLPFLLSCSNVTPEAKNNVDVIPPIKQTEKRLEDSIIQYTIKERITYWEARLPELDIKSDELFSNMVSDAIESMKPKSKNYKKYTYIRISSEYSRQNNKDINVRASRESFSPEGYINNDDFNGYFYSEDSLLVLTMLGSPAEVTLKNNGKYKTFIFVKQEIFDLPTNIIRDPIFVDYIIRNDSLYKMLPICTTIHESKELVAHRKPRPKIYR